MTTINNIADLVQVLKDEPGWADTIRSILLSDELLNLPARLAEFSQLMQENARQTNERLERVETAQEETNQQVGLLAGTVEQLGTGMNRLEVTVEQLGTRMNRLEDRFGNFEGSDYERKVRFRALHRAQSQFGLENPYLALTQSDPVAPQLNSAMAQAISRGSISREQSEDLHEADIIICDPRNRHRVIEVSLTADEGDIDRAKRRASILADATGGTVIPAVITASLNDAQQSRATAEGVATIIVSYP